MSGIATEKAAARTEAARARDRAHAANPGAFRQISDRVLAEVGKRPSLRRVAAYLSIRSEIDPGPAMLALHARGLEIGVPVIEGRGRPLAFRRWTPTVELVKGAFGVSVPADDVAMEPELLLVPLLAFDDDFYRLGYGGGFYDRTLELMRARGPVLAFGLGFAAQRLERLPTEATDARLDAIITEQAILSRTA